MIGQEERSGREQAAGTLLCPLSLTVEPMARFCNAELVDHPVYDGFELQGFDDPGHGRGLLAFLRRRADRRVDYYLTPGLDVDPSGYTLGAGTGAWVRTTFSPSRMDMGPDGVAVDVGFVDVDGRAVRIRFDDTGAGPREAGDVLAPVGADIDAPGSLLLVLMHGFDLLRRHGPAPQITFDGQPAAVGRLPGARWHGRHLIKAAAPLTIAQVCPTVDHAPLAPVDPHDPGPVVLDAEGHAIAGLAATRDGTTATLALTPPLPPLDRLPDGSPTGGAWRVWVDHAPITGGRWTAARRGQRVELELRVTRRWRPASRLPLLMRIVTRVVPTFRRWPTTYRYRAEVALGRWPTVTGRWERVGRERGRAYRRAIGG